MTETGLPKADPSFRTASEMGLPKADPPFCPVGKTVRFPPILYGGHISTAGGLLQAFTEYIHTRPHLRCYQIYAASGHSQVIPERNIEEGLRCRELLASYDKQVYIHACLVTNLCGTVKLDADPTFSEKRMRYISILAAELDLGVLLDAKGVIVHFGSAKDATRGATEMASVISAALIAPTKQTSAIARALHITPAEVLSRRIIILENSAHEGTKLGWSLAGIAEVLSQITTGREEQTGVCIDTAHAFGAGVFDFGRRSEIRRFYREMEETTYGDGDVTLLSKLRCFHFNDVREDVKYGARVDRHANLTIGCMFSEGKKKRVRAMLKFIEEAVARGIPLICEPPAKKKGMTVADLKFYSSWWGYQKVDQLMGEAGKERWIHRA